jgi:DNA-directed RNA polymerase subunit RPC12/RpoP
MPNRCADCGATDAPDRELEIICADYGWGAFLAVLCPVCDHRRWYKAHLLDLWAEKKLRAMRERV